MSRYYEREMPSDNDCWLSVFRMFDTNHDGFIGSNELKRFVRESSFSFGLSSREAAALIADADTNHDHLIDFAEFCVLMSKAKKLRMKRLMFGAAQMVVPRSQRTAPFSYLQQYTCLPPPLFMIFISIAEIAIYAYYVMDSGVGIQVNKPVPTYSPLIFNPYKLYEAWRFVTYMFIHIGIYHVVFNVLTQILLGVPLELVHKQWRVALVYLSGVIAGSLLVSLVDPRTYLAGASGGVYALLASHIAELLVNWTEMEFALVRALAIAVLTLSDFGVAIYQRYYVGVTSEVSFTSHVAGFVAGALMGVLVLRNFRKRPWERAMWWICLTAFSFLLAAAIVLNILPRVLQ